MLVRDHGYTGSYKAVVRHRARRYGKPRVRELRRLETPPGVQAQHDWFEVRVPIGPNRRRIQALVGALSHSRARFCWASRDQSQLAWHTGHVALFERYGGVPLWVRIDNLKTGVASGAGSHAVLNRSYEIFARTCGFEMDPCRPRKGSDKGKAERSVRTFRGSFGEVFRQGAGSMEELKVLLDREADGLLDRLECPVTGTSVWEAWESERPLLRPLPSLVEPFDILVSRTVHRDCLVSFEGRRYRVRFAWVGRRVEIWGTLNHVIIRAEGEEIARHARGTRQRLLIDPRHYEGTSTDRVERPTPLGARAQLQMAGLSSPSRLALLAAPDPWMPTSSSWRPIDEPGHQASDGRPRRDRQAVRSAESPPRGPGPARAPGGGEPGRSHAHALPRPRPPAGARAEERAPDRHIPQAERAAPRKTLEGFDWTFQSRADRGKLDALATCAFIRQADNVLFMGPPGVGKSHLAVALGVKAVKNGFSTQHYILDDLMHVLKGDAAVPPRRLRSKRYLNSALLVIDEIGFRPLDREEANLFFRLVSARYEKGSIILTSNKYVRDWPEIFAGDEILTTAILDRLLHHVHIIHIDGRSHRLRELDGLLAQQQESSPPRKRGETITS